MRLGKLGKGNDQRNLWELEMKKLNLKGSHKRIKSPRSPIARTTALQLSEPMHCLYRGRTAKVLPWAADSTSLPDQPAEVTSVCAP